MLQVKTLGDEWEHLTFEPKERNLRVYSDIQKQRQSQKDVSTDLEIPS